MINLFTIGFAGKSAREFFDLLTRNNVKRVIDIRLRPDSQLSGFAKGKDLMYFLSKHDGIEYLHWDQLCPTSEILDLYKQKKINWDTYAKQYFDLLKSRASKIDKGLPQLENACLLCSEAAEEKCHRRLAAEYLKENYPEIQILHLRGQNR